MIFGFNFVSSFLIQQEMPTVIYFVNNSSCFSGGGLNLSAISKVDKTILKKRLSSRDRSTGTSLLISWMPALTIVEICLKDRLRNIMGTWQWYGKSIMIEMNCEESSKVLNTICYTTVHNSSANNQEDYNKCLLDAWNLWTRKIHQNPVECWSPWQAQKWKREGVGRKALFCPFLLMPSTL